MQVKQISPEVKFVVLMIKVLKFLRHFFPQLYPLSFLLPRPVSVAAVYNMTHCDVNHNNNKIISVRLCDKKFFSCRRVLKYAINCKINFKIPLLLLLFRFYFHMKCNETTYKKKKLLRSMQLNQFQYCMANGNGKMLLFAKHTE